ncbi:MAG: hypothetical protein JXR68_05120 [Bacteroidales bacterium]|nr:hypothetical protein [Bacteroidales bacterium]
MNILYLHGLDGALSDEKRKILEKFGNVIAPQLCYRNDNRIVDFLKNEYKKSAVDVIIGSSMGGYSGYFLSLIMDLPGLFFNPALPYKNTVQFISKINTERKKFAKIIIGKKDDTIKASDNISFLLNTISDNDNIKISIINQLEHRIPVYVFDIELNLFFSELKLN